MQWYVHVAVLSIVIVFTSASFHPVNQHKVVMVTPLSTMQLSPQDHVTSIATFQSYVALIGDPQPGSKYIYL